MGLALTIIMIIGAVFIGIFSIPNLVYVLRTKNTAGINLPLYFILLGSCICFMLYGMGMVIDKNPFAGLPTMIANIVCIVICIVTLVIKFSNMFKAKKAGLTELKYWEAYSARTKKVK